MDDLLRDAIASKQKELEELEADINNIEQEADKLKPTVVAYNEKKQKSSELKKLKRTKEKEINTVVSFFKTINEHYLDGYFPLFSKNDREASLNK